MNIKSFCLLFLLISASSVKSQKRDYIWTFGGDSANNGIVGMQIDFNDTNFNVKQLLLPHRNGNSHASICDVEGNLLFYTNGCAIINANQEVMPNGDNLNDDPWKELLNWDNCDFGYPSRQDNMIVPDPADSNSYYLFHKPFTYANEEITSQLWVSYIDMELDSGLGDVVYKDSLIFNERPLLTSYLELIPHTNGNDWWLTQPIQDDSLFLIMLISEQGILKMDYQNTHQYFDAFRSSASGSARFSPDGCKYAIYNYYDNLNIYDFDRSTGQLTHSEKIMIVENPDINLLKQGSLEWSPNSRFIYTVNQDSLFQIDTESDNVQTSVQLIETYDGTQNPFWATFNLQTLGPDCRIYITSGSSSETFHVINKPNELGLGCDFRQNGIQLPQPHANTNLSLFPRFRVDAEDKCDSTITSIFGEVVYYRFDLTSYPNPASDKITVEVPDLIGNATFIIYSNTGEVMLEKPIYNAMTRLEEDISFYPEGIYHIEVYPDINPERKVYACQLVKVR